CIAGRPGRRHFVRNRHAQAVEYELERTQQPGFSFRVSERFDHARPSICLSHHWRVRLRKHANGLARLVPPLRSKAVIPYRQILHQRSAVVSSKWTYTTYLGATLLS